MKTTLFLVVSMIIASNICNGKTISSKEENKSIQQKQTESINKIEKADSILKGIERRIFNAFVNGNMNQNEQALVSLEEALLNLNTNKNNELVVYWYSYACYYHSILFMILNDNKKSEKILEVGIDKLSEINQKTSEHLALLALMESFSIQFAPGIQAAFISKSVKENAEKALALDSLNLRAYYVLGSNDFYTPEQYGGGKKAESYFKKAIQLDNQPINNSYLPGWGKNSAYELLIRLYIRNKQFEEAKLYYSQAIELYPNDYMINKLAAELINH
jgi:hypothetical protein